MVKTDNVTPRTAWAGSHPSGGRPDWYLLPHMSPGCVPSPTPDTHHDPDPSPIGNCPLTRNLNRNSSVSWVHWALDPPSLPGGTIVGQPPLSLGIPLALRLPLPLLCRVFGLAYFGPRSRGHHLNCTRQNASHLVQNAHVFWTAAWHCTCTFQSGVYRTTIVFVL